MAAALGTALSCGGEGSVACVARCGRARTCSGLGPRAWAPAPGAGEPRAALCATESWRRCPAGALGVRAQGAVAAGRTQRPEGGEAGEVGRCPESPSPEPGVAGGTLSGRPTARAHRRQSPCRGCFRHRQPPSCLG